MRVVFSNVGSIDRVPTMEAELDAIPNVGDTIAWKGVSPENQIVRTVVWAIEHDEDDQKINEPYVYVVVGPRRR